jgi:hypothetical protein
MTVAAYELSRVFLPTTSVTGGFAGGEFLVDDGVLFSVVTIAVGCAVVGVGAGAVVGGVAIFGSGIWRRGTALVGLFIGESVCFLGSLSAVTVLCRLLSCAMVRTAGALTFAGISNAFAAGEGEGVVRGEECTVFILGVGIAGVGVLVLVD